MRANDLQPGDVVITKAGTWTVARITKATQYKRQTLIRTTKGIEQAFDPDAYLPVLNGCIAGNSAVDGKCDDKECVCH